MSPKIDIEQVRRAARNSIPLSIKTYTLPHETEEYLEQILSIFLAEFGQSEIKDRIAYCMRELAVNAKKANTKRVYFKELELKIDSDAEYETGMRDFKQTTLENINHYLELQKQAGLYIKVVFHAQGKSLTVSVHNNVKISRKEQLRVYDRVARARAFETMEEALSTVLDDSEGAGLGIVIMVLMLKKIGLDEDAFDIDVIDSETVAKIVVPFSEIHVESLDSLSREIIAEIDVLPQFPDNVVYLQKLLSDPDSEMSDIARQISMDPSLTAELLKIVNSAAFMTARRVDNIVEAVKFAGIRTLKSLLYQYGTQSLLDAGAKWLWDHSYQAAFYAYTLARYVSKRRDILDDVYAGGILHDMGKIIFSSVHPDLLEKIQDFAVRSNMDRDLFEDLAAGLNHSEIGALIAEKWNFPDLLIAAIRFHHEPSSAPGQYSSVVNTVYLANALCDLEKQALVYDQIDPATLNEFSITSEQQLRQIHDRLKVAFTRESSKGDAV
jgi:putative nucleotidyltransferase with HDIG domain